MRYDQAVWASGDLTTTEVVIALAWAQPSYEVGVETNASFAQIARLAKVIRGTAIIATQSLVAKKYLEVVERRDFKPTTYRTRLPSQREE